MAIVFGAIALGTSTRMLPSAAAGKDAADALYNIFKETSSINSKKRKETDKV